MSLYNKKLYPEFYVLKPIGGRFGTRYAYGEQVKPIYTGDFTQCPICDSPVTTRLWIPPHRIKISTASPSKWGDILWGDGFSIMGSEKLIDIFKKVGGLGIEKIFNPAHIVQIGRKKLNELDQPLPKYHLIKIKWGGANLDDKGSQVVRSRVSCDFCRSGHLHQVNKIVFEANSWSGDDIFFARGVPGVIIVSDKFKDWVENYSLTNILLIPIENYAYEELSGWFVKK